MGEASRAGVGVCRGEEDILHRIGPGQDPFEAAHDFELDGLGDESQVGADIDDTLPAPFAAGNPTMTGVPAVGAVSVTAAVLPPPHAARASQEA
jgi:hypothetical protein